MSASQPWARRKAAAKARYAHAQRRVFQPLGRVHCVFGFEVEPFEVGQDPQHRHAGFLCEPLEARLEQRNIAAEAVDDEALYARLLARLEHCECAVEVREHAALVDVGDDDDIGVGSLGESHVGEVVLAQVDLGRAARAFDQDAVVPGLQSVEGGEDGRHQFWLVRVVGAGVERAGGAAVDDHLGPGVGLGLEQHRVHVGVGVETAGLGLHRLRATDLTAVGGDGAVECHVLRFERRDADAAAVQRARDTGDHGALARVRGGALDHESGR